MRRFLLGACLVAGCTASSGTMSGDASLDGSRWLELDLSDGQVSSVDAPDAQGLARPRWRTSHVLFRRVEAGAIAIDASSMPDGGEPEDQDQATGGMAYIAVFELTRAQWSRLAGTGDDTSDLPATGLSPDDILIAIAACDTSRLHLDLPDDGLWSVACSGGRNTVFSWGNGTAEAAVGTYAVHQPVDEAGPRGPEAVGSRTANPFGLYDLHGNAWEIVRLGDGFAARGGAWDSPALQCRTMNRVDMPASVAHPSIGVRLVLRP